ncbi:MAG: helix-turn-helix transcriptional regulator [Cytophagales bacterium]|nr:helix-turn-helix transcriptional regulator [Cytophagales bacterium]
MKYSNIKNRRAAVLKSMGAITFEESLDKHYGKIGTSNRDEFELESKLEIIGEILKQARKSQNLTQEKIAQSMGIDKTNISKIENNVKRQRIDTILRFVNALDARMSIKIKLNGEHNEFEMVF